MKLTEQKCMACEGGIEPLTMEEAQQLGKQVPNWTITEKQIERTFKFKNFVEAMDFANEITKIAESENHHPNLHISYGKVKVDLYTHAVNGITINDFIVASKIDEIM
ncbi:MAG: 4a-hydroxytetrahydrobiopterin dehydratase [Armatimonadota bacterium]